MEEVEAVGRRNLELRKALLLLCFGKLCCKKKRALARCGKHRMLCISAIFSMPCCTIAHRRLKEEKLASHFVRRSLSWSLGGVPGNPLLERTNMVWRASGARWYILKWLIFGWGCFFSLTLLKPYGGEVVWRRHGASNLCAIQARSLVDFFRELPIYLGLKLQVLPRALCRQMGKQNSAKEKRGPA